MKRAPRNYTEYVDYASAAYTLYSLLRSLKMSFSFRRKDSDLFNDIHLLVIKCLDTGLCLHRIMLIMPVMPIMSVMPVMPVISVMPVMPIMPVIPLMHVMPVMPALYNADLYVRGTVLYSKMRDGGSDKRQLKERDQQIAQMLTTLVTICERVPAT